MYKKLRMRFLWGSALILLLVIILVVGILFWITANTVTRQSQVFIEKILENDGELPDRGEFAPRQETMLALNDESLNETRFFSVLFSNGESRMISKLMAFLSDEELTGMAQQALEKNGESGQLDGNGPRVLHYGKKTLEDGSVLVVIADSTSRYGLTRLIIIYMAVLWLIVLTLFVLIMGHYSGKMIRPFIENDEKQKRFITNASHELKTPLAVIAANNEMTEAVSGKTRWTESTGRQVKRLQSLIENLVVLTRLDEVKEMVPEEIDISGIVRETADSFRDVIEASGKRFERRIESGLRVHGEKRTVQQITSILVDNAAKYCDRGGVILVSLSGKGKGAQLCVSNTYAEGKNTELSRFFERFYRQDESHHSGKSGFGIGLSMAKEMTERMKGRMSVGCTGDIITFTVELP